MYYMTIQYCWLIYIIHKNLLLIIKINYFNFFTEQNTNAIHLLKQNMDKIDWWYLSVNPNIFEIDTKQLKLDITEQAKIIDSIIYE